MILLLLLGSEIDTADTVVICAVKDYDTTPLFHGDRDGKKYISRSR